MRPCDLQFLLVLIPLTAWAGTGEIAGTVGLNGQNQPVAGAIIYLAGVRQAAPPNLSPVVLDQQRDQFVPRVQLARAGGPLILQNSDPYLHVLRLELLQGGQKPRLWLRQVTPYAGFEKRCVLPAVEGPALLRAVGENGQGRMVAYIAVMPHPWAALTDPQGRYQIANVPPGEYQLFAWHETLGTLIGQVRVASGRTSGVRFDFPRAP